MRAGFGERNQHLFLAIDECRGVIAGQFEAMAMCNGVGGTRLNAVPAEDAAVVIDVVDLSVALSAAEAPLFGVFRCLNVNTVGRTGGCAEKAGHALLKAILVALKNVGAAVTLLHLGGAIRILFRDSGLQHLLESDAHAFGDCCR